MTAIGRRQFLQWAGVAAAAVPVARLATAQESTELASAPFLSPDEYDLVRAATARVIPSDATPGALEAGVADYIQRLLTMGSSADANCDGRRSAADLIAETAAVATGGSACADADVAARGVFDEAGVLAALSAMFARFSQSPRVPPLVFAGGPFSGREPFVDAATMQPSDDFPPNSFRRFVPLNRVQAIAWKARLDGPDAAPELAGNPLVSGPQVNLRQQYRTGLALIEATSRTAFGEAFVDLTPARQSQVLANPSLASFMRVLRGHTMEGMFAAPEYGGNRDGIGWQLIGYGGDSQPLGYTLGFDEQTGEYVERADRPNSRPNPDEDCVGLSPRVLNLMRILVGNQPGFREFAAPFCFGVEP